MYHTETINLIDFNSYAKIIEQELVESAIKSMILKDLHRLFVVQKGNKPVSGVISLTDAARMRSGSCHACIVSRIRVDKNE